MAHVEKRGEGKYRIVERRFDPVEGRTKRFVSEPFIASSKSAAEKQIPQFIHYVDTVLSRQKDHDLYFYQFAQMWINDYAKPDLSPKTVKDYMGHLNNRILPYFKDIKLKKVTPIFCKRFFNDLNEMKNMRTGELLSGTSKKRIHELLSVMFKTAVNWQLITSSPIESIKAPKKNKAQIKIYELDQLKVLMESLNTLKESELKYKAFLLIMIATGMRPGEIIAIQESRDLDLETGVIHVNESTTYVNASIGSITKAPKTEQSVRSIYVPNFVVNAVKQYQEYKSNSMSLKKNFQESGYLFIQDNGLQMHPTTVSKWFPKYVERIGLPRITLYGLRHSSATLLLESGMNIKAIAKRLGHSDARMLLEVYGHATTRADQEAAAKMDDLFKVE